MMTDIRQPGRTEQRIAEGMQEHIRITMAYDANGVLDPNSPQPERTALTRR
jgi:hypothetical protein